MIHSKEEYEKAVEASAILFGGSTSEALRKLDEETLLQVFEGVPQFRIARAELAAACRSWTSAPRRRRSSPRRANAARWCRAAACRSTRRRSPTRRAR